MREYFADNLRFKMRRKWKTSMCTLALHQDSKRRLLQEEISLYASLFSVLFLQAQVPINPVCHSPQVLY